MESGVEDTHGMLSPPILAMGNRRSVWSSQGPQTGEPDAECGCPESRRGMWVSRISSIA
jgi:hypothetical protein